MKPTTTMPIDAGLQEHSHDLQTESFQPGSTVQISAPSRDFALERSFPPIGGSFSRRIAIGMPRTPVLTDTRGLLESEQCEQVASHR